MNNKIIEERKKIRERVEEILSNHEENTSEGAVYWEEGWVGGKKVPDGHGGYRIDGGERVSTGEAFYKELVHFIESEKKKSYTEGRIYQLEEDIEQVEMFVPKKVEDTERFWIPTQILMELEDDLKLLKSKLNSKDNGRIRTNGEDVS